MWKIFVLQRQKIYTVRFGLEQCFCVSVVLENNQQEKKCKIIRKNIQDELYLINLLQFDSVDVGRWKGMGAHWAQTVPTYLPKDVSE